MKRFFAPIQSFLEAAFLQLSQADGKPGLSVADLQVVLRKVEAAQESFSDEGAGQARAEFVREAMLRLFPNKFPSWVADILVWLAWAIAKRKGIIS